MSDLMSPRVGNPRSFSAINATMDRAQLSVEDAARQAAEDEEAGASIEQIIDALNDEDRNMLTGAGIQEDSYARPLLQTANHGDRQPDKDAAQRQLFDDLELKAAQSAPQVREKTQSLQQIREKKEPSKPDHARLVEGAKKKAQEMYIAKMELRAARFAHSNALCAVSKAEYGRLLPRKTPAKKGRRRQKPPPATSSTATKLPTAASLPPAAAGNDAASSAHSAQESPVTGILTPADKSPAAEAVLLSTKNAAALPSAVADESEENRLAARFTPIRLHTNTGIPSPGKSEYDVPDDPPRPESRRVTPLGKSRKDSSTTSPPAPQSPRASSYSTSYHEQPGRPAKRTSPATPTPGWEDASSHSNSAPSPTSSSLAPANNSRRESNSAPPHQLKTYDDWYRPDQHVQKGRKAVYTNIERIQGDEGIVAPKPCTACARRRFECRVFKPDVAENEGHTGHQCHHCRWSGGGCSHDKRKAGDDMIKTSSPSNSAAVKSPKTPRKRTALQDIPDLGSSRELSPAPAPSPTKKMGKRKASSNAVDDRAPKLLRINEEESLAPNKTRQSSNTAPGHSLGAPSSRTLSGPRSHTSSVNLAPTSVATAAVPPDGSHTMSVAIGGALLSLREQINDMKRQMDEMQKEQQASAKNTADKILALRTLLLDIIGRTEKSNGIP